jgi:cation diffusion facilitator CzcD-associated flavoprotein CzcO
VSGAPRGSADTTPAAAGATGGVDVDVIIVGAGLSGIGAAYRLRERLPAKRIALLEGRGRLGGTWDLFRYPGVRSDSDMYTLGYPFRPWTRPTAIADGASILGYLRDTADEATISDDIRYGHHVTAASWDGGSATWTLSSRTPTGVVRHTCRFLYLATGYYRYDHGHVVDFPGREDFAGPVVHPQLWPEDLDVAGRRVVVIGSGATAVTLVPALVEEGAAQVTMLQRSPSYLVSLPGDDPVARVAARLLPERTAYRVTRAKNIAANVASFQLARRFPGAARRLLVRGVARQLPEGYDVGTHFSPRYDPWDERLCVVPDADLFRAVSSGSAEVVTDTVDRFTDTGVRLTSGRELAADVIVTATGLALQVAGGIDVTVDGRPVRMSEGYAYKGLMFSDVPNLAWCVGYTNNSWTLRADLAATYVCRLLAVLDERGLTTATPRFDGVPGATRPLLDLTSGYIRRSAAMLPRQGERRPWRLRQNYLVDLVDMRLRRVDDGRLELTRAGRRPSDPDEASTTSAATPAPG